MRKLRALFLRLTAGLRLTRSDAELSEELRSHFEMLVHEYTRRGLPEGEARRAAAAKFGSMPAAEEAFRDRRGLPTLEHWFRDCRYAARSLTRTGILSMSMVLVLALGIAGSTTVATIVYAVVWRPLPVPNPERVVKLALGLGGEFDRRVEGHASHFSYPELTLYQGASRSLSGLAGFRQERVTWRRSGERRALRAALVTANYFSVLQVRPAVGRLLSDGDRHQPVAVISERLWDHDFARAPSVLGASLLIDRMGYTIIGVAASPFVGTELDSTDVWLPLDVAVPARGQAARLTDANLGWLQLVGRLAPDTSLVEAASEARLIAARYDVDYPGRRTTIRLTQASALDAGLLQPPDRDKVIGGGIVVSLVGIVLLMICTSNAAALLLARGAARQQEVALRIALGAGRGRIVQQLAAEALLIALGAAVTGLGLSSVVLRTIGHVLPLPEYFERYVPDLPSLWFAILSALGAALLFGFAPAMQATRIDPLPVLKGEGASLSTRMPGSRIRHRLVSAQVAVSVILLVASALLARGVERALRVDPGFAPKHLYAFNVDTTAGPSSVEERAQLVRRLLEALRSAGNPDSGFAMVAPFSGKGFSHVRPAHAAAPIPVQFNVVDAQYFRALGVAPVAGRSFEPHDTRAAVIVNRSLARAVWGDERAGLGQSLEYPDASTRPTADVADTGRPAAETVMRTAIVVGVMPTLQSTDVGVPDGPAFYVPPVGDELANGSLVVRGFSRSTLQRTVDGVVGSGDAANVIVPIEERVLAQTGPARIAATITVLIGVVALLVTSVGIYGIVAHAVVARTHEVGVHMALGAPNARVLRLVLSSSARAVATGVTFAALIVVLVGAVASRTIEPMLFGLSALDPLAIGAALALLAAVTLGAAYVPARRALSVGPMEALRHS